MVVASSYSPWTSSNTERVKAKSPQINNNNNNGMDLLMLEQ
jgi:hypothetical protein